MEILLDETVPVAKVVKPDSGMIALAVLMFIILLTILFNKLNQD